MQLFTHFAGQNGQTQFDSDDFVAQCKQALQKIVNKLACAQAGPEHILRMTWYVKKMNTSTVRW